MRRKTFPTHGAITTIVLLAFVLSMFVGPAQAAVWTYNPGPTVPSVDCTNYTLYPWMDPSKTPEQRANALLDAETLAQQMRWLDEQTMNTPDPTNCIPQVTYTDGPWGINSATGVTAPPIPIAQASTWDTALSYARGKMTGDEAFKVLKNSILAPGVQIMRNPLDGRNNEWLSEDPLLAGVIGAASIQGQQFGNPTEPNLAVAKHYNMNDQETNRTSQDSVVDERTMQEIYLPSFAAAVKAQVAGIMCSFNLVNGVYACESPTLLTTYLRDQLGWDGYVVSDFGSVHSTVNSLNAGLDQELNRPNFFSVGSLTDALNNGQITAARIREAAFHNLVPRFRVGIFDHPMASTPAANASSPQNVQTALNLALEGTVLLKNQSHILPIKTHGLKIAVIGRTASTSTGTPNATSVCSNQGVSCVISPTAPGAPALVTSLAGIQARAALDGDTVIYDDGTVNATAAITAANADVAIVFGHYLEQEFSDIPTLSLATATTTTLFAPVTAGATNVKVASTGGIRVDDTFTVDTGAAKETVKATAVGTQGRTTTLAPVSTSLAVGGTSLAAGNSTMATGFVGDKVVTVGSATNFGTGQTISIDIGANAETAVISSTTGTALYLAAPLTKAHAQNTAVAVVTPVGANPIMVASLTNFTNTQTINIDAALNAESATIAAIGPGGATTLGLPTAISDAVIKVPSVSGFITGTTVLIDTGANLETAVILSVGRTGATKAGAATAVGDTVIPVFSSSGFSVNQTITIDSGANVETRTVTAVAGSPNFALTVTPTLAIAHAFGVQVSGSGIALSAGLTKAHPIGVIVTGNYLTLAAPTTLAHTGNVAVGVVTPAGTNPIKVASVSNLTATQTITIDVGANSETAVIAEVGTAGIAGTGITLTAPTALTHTGNAAVATVTPAGSSNIKVASVTGFSVGDTLLIDTGANLETVTATAVGTAGATGTGVTITPTLALTHTGSAQVQDLGTGITFTPALAQAHAAGAGILSSQGDNLISAVAAAQPNTIVVLQTGGPVTMPWIDSVKGVVEEWYSGVQGGNALAQLLWGDVNFSGKLPETFPRSMSDLPTAGSVAQYPGIRVNNISTVTYTEGIFMGYRWYDAQNITPLFPFGHGLSYSTFDYSNLNIQPSGRGLAVSFTLHNFSLVTGTEVPQVYIGMPAGLGEPPKRLAGFARVLLAPGESQDVTVTIDPDSFNHPLSYWDTPTHQWVTPYGSTYTVYVGASSRDIRLLNTTVPHDASTLTISVVGDGVVSPTTGTYTYTYGTVVPVTATANTGSSFAGWSGDLSGSVDPTAIMMTGNKWITATFSLNTYTLMVASVGDGVVAPTVGAHTYTYGTVVPVTATANITSTFTGWSGDLSGNVNPTTITMTSDKSITATFDYVIYKVYLPIVMR